MMFSDEQHPKEKKRNRTAAYTGIAGVVVGAALFAFAVPTVSKMGSQGGEGQSEARGTQMMPVSQGPSQVMNVDVRTGFVDAVDKASEAVVGVINIQKDSFSEADAEAGTGSGVIYKVAGDKAYIVTNNHVVEGATRLEVSFSNGRKTEAKLLGRDVVTDLAVLQISSKDVKKVIEIGDSTKVRRGEPAIAIGNPLGLEFSGTVTQGIISANERIVPVDLDKDGHYDWQVEVLQTDAAINPGNSGGALVNVAGQLIGINSMKIAAQEVEGIGLAIPISRALPVIDELEKTGKVQRPYLGVELRSLNEIPGYYLDRTLEIPQDVVDGVCILDVKSPSPAMSAGLREYDVIVEADGKPVRDIIEFRTLLYSKKVGEEMKLTFYRSNDKKTATVKLSAGNY